MINLTKNQTFVHCSFYKKEIAHLENLFKSSYLILNESSLKVANKKFIFFVQNLSLDFVSIIHSFLLICKSFSLKINVIIRLISYLNSNKNVVFINSQILFKLKPLVLNILSFLKSYKVSINTLKLFIKYRYKSGFKKIRNSKCNFELLSLLKIVHAKNNKILYNIIQGEILVNKNSTGTNTKNSAGTNNKNSIGTNTKNSAGITTKNNDDDNNISSRTLNHIIFELQKNVKNLTNYFYDLQEKNVIRKDNMIESVYNLTKLIYYDMKVFLNSKKVKDFFEFDLYDPVQNEILKKVKDFLILFKDFICSDSCGTIKYCKNREVFSLKNFIEFEEFLIKEVKKKGKPFTNNDFCNILKDYSKTLNIRFCRAGVEHNIDVLKGMDILKYDIELILEVLQKKKLGEISETFGACALFIDFCFKLHGGFRFFFSFADSLSIGYIHSI